MPFSRSDEPTPPERSAGGTTRTVLLGMVAVTVIAFMFVNLDQVEVNWIVGSAQTPLIVVIVVSVLLGAGGDRLATHLSRRHSRRADESRPN